jgi:erythronate-4-phosphate dehydrogenase
MPSHAYLINSSRGPVVDNQALSYHLKEKTIAGAILDVWEEEPNLNKTLLNQVMIGTPHIAGYSQDGKANATSQVVRGIGNAFDIEPLKTFDLHLEKQTLEIEPLVEDDFLSLRAIFKKTYDIRKDSLLLKHSPDNFETFRKNYPVRREPRAYELKTLIKKENIRRVLEKLGFHLCVDSHFV